MLHGQLGEGDGETDKSKDATGAALERPTSWFQLGGDCGHRVDSRVRAKSWSGHIFTCSALDIKGGGERQKGLQTALKLWSIWRLHIYPIEMIVQMWQDVRIRIFISLLF